MEIDPALPRSVLCAGRQLIQRNFNPRHRTAGATGLTISDGDSHLIKTRWKGQRLSPLDEATIFGEYYFPRDLEFLLEAWRIDRDRPERCPARQRLPVIYHQTRQNPKSRRRSSLTR